MDRAKLIAKIVVAAGLVWVWPGPHFLPSWTGPIGPDGSTRTAAPTPAPTEAAAWFREVRPSCNAVEVEATLRRSPAPADHDGRALEATCLALAGRIERARSVIESMPMGSRWKAAGVVFDHAHPVADAGDELAAGPVMELVVEFWPNHYMALYHAGAAAYQRGDLQRADGYLERFLETYGPKDGWTRNALQMRAAIAEG